MQGADVWSSLDFQGSLWIDKEPILQEIVFAFIPEAFVVQPTPVITRSNIPVDLLLTWINFNSAWVSNYIHYNVGDEITYPFLIFNGGTVEV